jgi:hypothetical protein
LYVKSSRLGIRRQLVQDGMVVVWHKNSCLWPINNWHQRQVLLVLLGPSALRMTELLGFRVLLVGPSRTCRWGQFTWAKTEFLFVPPLVPYCTSWRLIPKRDYFSYKVIFKSGTSSAHFSCSLYQALCSVQKYATHSFLIYTLHLSGFVCTGDPKWKSRSMNILHT